MKSVQDQLAAVLAVAVPVPALDVVLTDAAGCILAADIVVTEDIPSRPLATCDGYAVRSQDLVGASPENPVVLPILGFLFSIPCFWVITQTAYAQAGRFILLTYVSEVSAWYVHSANSDDLL